MGDEARIRLFLAAVRRRLRVRQIAEELTVALGLAAGALLLLLLIAGGARPGAGWRVALAALGGGSAAGVLLALARPLRRWRRDEPVARLIGERTGDGDVVLSAVELTRSLPALDSEPRVASPALARAHLAEAALRLGRTEPRRVAPWLPSRVRLAACGLIAVAYLGLIVGARQRLVRGVAMLREREASPTAAPASAEPLVGDIELRLTFPAHTALPPRTTPGSSGDVLAPPGTEVLVRARPLVGVKGARLEVEDGGGKLVEQRPAQFANGIVEGRFTVGKAPGGYRFVFDRTALQSKGFPRALREPEPHRVEIDPDRAPKVTLAAPADDLELDSPRPVQLAWSAEDDYGLGDVELVWEGPGTPGAAGSAQEARRIGGRKLVRKATPGGRGASGMLEWDIASLALTPGVRITYHVEARDNDDVSGPNVGTSRSYTLRIYSATERHDELLAAEQALVDRSVEVLGDRLEAPRGASGEPEARALSAAHARTEDLLSEIAKLRAALDKDPLAPRDLRPAIAGIGSRLGRVQHDEKAPLAAFVRAADSDAARRGAEAVSGRHAAELEKDIILLDDLIGRQRIEQLLGVTDQMQQARDRIRALLAEYKRTRSDAVKQDIERELRLLEQKLAELAEKATRLAGEVPDEFVNREALGDNDLQKRLDAIHELIEHGEVDKAMEEMKRLSRSLDKMVAGLEGDLRGFRGERFSADEKALADLENRLSDLEHDQRQIQEDTNAVRARQRDEAKRLARERIEPFVKRAKERVAEMKRKLAAVDRDQIPSLQQEDFDRMRRRVEDLGAALEQGELEEAADAARNASELLRGLSYMLHDEEDRRWTGARAGVRRAREKVDEAEPIARQLADELDQLMPRPGELLGPDERRKLEALAARQEALQKRTDELRRDSDRRGGRPSSGPQPPPSSSGPEGAGGQSPEREGAPAGLRSASEHMGRAGEALHAGNPRDSYGEEGQAAEQLAKMRQDIQNERRPKNDGGAGGMASKEPVRIPGADEFRAPREFRQDLLDAMKREAPLDYREQVKRYYEELVR